jgi:hypothetical protein
MSRLTAWKIDRLGPLIYLAALAGCGGGAPPLVIPAGGSPATSAQVRAWADSLQAGAPVLHRFKWQYRDRDQAAGGRGSARIAGSDSLRLDMIGPLGAGRGAAFVIGSTEQWAEPEEEVRKVAPNYQLLWAMLGIPRLPESFDAVTRFDGPGLVAWRLVRGADTVEFARQTGPEGRFMADVREAGVRVARVQTTYNVDGSLKSSRLDVPRGPARLDLNYYATSRPASFPADTWHPPDREP